MTLFLKLLLKHSRIFNNAAYFLISEKSWIWKTSKWFEDMGDKFEFSSVSCFSFPANTFLVYKIVIKLAYFLACLLACLLASLLTSLLTYLLTYFTYLLTYLLTYSLTYSLTYLVHPGWAHVPHFLRVGLFAIFSEMNWHDLWFSKNFNGWMPFPTPTNNLSILEKLKYFYRSTITSLSTSKVNPHGSGVSIIS